MLPTRLKRGVLRRGRCLLSAGRLLWFRRHRRLPITSSRYIRHVEGFVARILDPEDFYIQYKDEYVHRIYDFDTTSRTPLVIDGGANIGLSVLRAKSRYPNARVIAFEPDRQVFEVLTQNLERNELDDVTVFNAALGAADGTATFSPDGSSGGRLDNNGTTTVAVRRLSDFLREPVDFVKLNIEGAELEVLSEAAEAGVLGNVDQLVVEYHGWPRGDQDLGQILKLLDAEGFRYLVHDFDSQTNAGSKPPFRLRETPWFALVYAKNTGER